MGERQRLPNWGKVKILLGFSIFFVICAVIYCQSWIEYESRSEAEDEIVKELIKKYNDPEDLKRYCLDSEGFFIKINNKNWVGVYSISCRKDLYGFSAAINSKGNMMTSNRFYAHRLIDIKNRIKQYGAIKSEDSKKEYIGKYEIDKEIYAARSEGEVFSKLFDYGFRYYK